jgi:sigma-B regulation protein RsbU (phosphoserine phosphatase)
MRRWSTLPRPFLATLAGLFAVVAILYGSLWMYAVRHPGPVVELGFNQLHNPNYDPRTHSLSVDDVIEGSPAAQAGLRPGDRIIAVNGRPLGTEIGFDDSYVRGHPGDPVSLTIDRPGEPKPLVLHAVFRAKRSLNRAGEGLARSSALQVIGSYPAPFLLVGFAVLFLRLEEPTAWLLALLFCAFIAPPDLAIPSGVSPALAAFMLAFRATFLGMLGPLFYLFFAEFPARSPLDRRLPWLKWAALAFGVCIVLPGLRAGHPCLPRIAVEMVGTHNADLIVSSFIYALFALGIFSLAQNSFTAAVPPEARRKSRVILWGTIVGVLPIVLERLAVDFTGFRPSFWLDTVLILVLSLYPLSFAYAVVKHRVMDIPVLLRRSARYVLVQRGFTILLLAIWLVAIRLFMNAVSGLVGTYSNTVLSVSLVFGFGLVWISAPLVKRGTARIDRAFFRSAYDARVILQDLAEKTRTVTGRRELAILLEKHIKGALQPKSFACYLDAGDGNLVAEFGPAAQEFSTIPPALPRPLFPFRFGVNFVPREAQTIPATMPLLSEIAQRGKAWDVPEAHAAAGDLGPLAPECLVPILGRDSGLVGLLVLGRRLSEEQPYSGEDKNLLDSVAAQAGITLDNIRLAEKMAERIEAERRVEREMEIAREVQARLFPQKLPAMKTLEYIGGCIPARAVGGDYYDFLELHEGRLALVLADIAGKGVSGALLMANLQANLRSQCATGLYDLPRTLASVNHSFCESTGDSGYATLFFADYDDCTRKLRYANCGHLPPLLLCGDGGPVGDEGPGGDVGDVGHAGAKDQPSGMGKVRRLDATSMVVGLFSDWQCEVAEVKLAPGDTLVLYTDGITEARSAAGEEFGESRLIDALRSYCHLPVGPLLQAIVGAVRQFSAGEQQDDITMVIARSLP